MTIGENNKYLEAVALAEYLRKVLSTYLRIFDARRVFLELTLRSNENKYYLISQTLCP